MTLDQAIQLIQADPAAFLRAEYLIVAGGANHRAAETICAMDQRQAAGGGWRVLTGFTQF